jgi:hypothetical protein
VRPLPDGRLLEYQMSAVMWFHGLLQDWLGITMQHIRWLQLRFDNENAGRREGFSLTLPDGFPLTAVTNSDTSSTTVADGGGAATLCLSGSPAGTPVGRG